MNEQTELLCLKEVATIIGCCQSTIYNMLYEGRMPAPIRLRGSIRWRRGEINDWIANLPRAHHRRNRLELAERRSRRRT